MLVPLGGGLAAFAIIALGHFANHPEDFAPRIDAVRAEARAVEPRLVLERVRNALDRDTEVDALLRLPDPAGGSRDSTEAPVLKP